MSLAGYLRTLWYVIMFTALQVIVFRNFSLWSTGFCFAYIGSILLLPLEASALLVMIAAFGIGLLTDMFYNTPGMHAALSVLVAFLRITSIKILTPAGGYEGDTEVSVEARGANWYFRYMTPLIFIHHLGLFALEYADLGSLHIVLINAVVSTPITLGVIFGLQQVIGYRSGSNR
jgi:hypothetical protein